jgi:hypothetical protein
MKKTNRHSTQGRRRFLKHATGIAAAALSTDLLGATEPAQSRSGSTVPIALRGNRRRDRAFEIRNQAALTQRNAAWPEQLANGDEARYADRIASFTKSLPHDRLGHVQTAAYDALVKATASGEEDDFENVPLGGSARLADPQAAFAYSLTGSDSQQFTLPLPPRFDSEEQAGEMVEMYWHALLRDVSFSEYATHPLAATAAEDLSRFKQFRGPNGEALKPTQLFRGPTPGDRMGPYISQFLLKDVPYGARRRDQRIRTAVPGDDYMLTYREWLAIQNGGAAGVNRTDQTQRYIINGRDLGEYVHWDFTYQAFLDAALTIIGSRVALDSRNPYRTSVTQAGFGTFGGPHVLDLVAHVAGCALKVAWFQKWVVHRRLRPEEFGGRVHNHLTGAAKYPIHDALLQSPALEATLRRHTTYLLPQAYPEGAPVHPSYPAGHAMIAGACATALKACFHETSVIAEPVTTGSSGQALTPYNNQAERLTVGGELNKLASNIAIGRDFAGLHWRSDSIEGIKLGEAVALSVMRDMKECYHQLFRGFSLTKFDGSTVIV